MSLRKAWWIGAVVVVGAASWWWWSSRSSVDEQDEQLVASESAPPASSRRAIPPGRTGPVRPSTPPIPGIDEPPPVDQPEVPPEAAALRRAAYEQAVADRDPRPGDKAFRAMVSAFMDYNRPLAEAQARAEGLSLEEVEELTYFGLLAQQTQRWSEVEEVLGGPVDEQVQAQASTLLHELDTEFEQSMRDLVAEGVSQEDRWALIRSVQGDYLERYLETTGMDEDQLDDLLAGDASREYAPGSTPPPQDVEPRDDPPAPVETRQGEPAPR